MVYDSSYVGIRAQKVESKWLIKKIQLEGVAAQSNINVNDEIIAINGSTVLENKILNRWLIVEQAKNITIVSDAQKKVIVFPENNLNNLRFNGFFWMGLLGIFYLFYFAYRQVYSRTSEYFYGFIVSLVFAFLALVPSSVGDSFGRLIVILFISFVPIYLYAFLEQKKNLRLIGEQKIVIALLFVAIINVTLFTLEVCMQVPSLISEYLSMGVFYYLAIVLMAILFLDVRTRAYNKKTIRISQVNLPRIMLLSFTPLLLFYIFPAKAVAPFSVTVLFTVLPVVVILHLLTLSKLISYRYNISVKQLYIQISLILTTIVIFVVFLGRFISIYILCLYSFLLFYAFVPLISEIILMLRNKGKITDGLALFSAVEEERENISMFIHDNVLQNIIYSMKQIESADEQLTNKQTLLVLDETVFYLRELCTDIYPVMIQEIGLEPAILAMLKQMEKRHPVNIIYRSTDVDFDYSVKVKTFILRAITELVNNSILHGNAKKVILDISVKGRYCIFKVRDDGEYITNQDDEHAHFGLGVIKEKLALLQGDLSIDLKKDTLVTMKVPIEMKKEDSDENEDNAD